MRVLGEAVRILDAICRHPWEGEFGSLLGGLPRLPDKIFILFFNHSCYEVGNIGYNAQEGYLKIIYSNV